MTQFFNDLSCFSVQYFGAHLDEDLKKNIDLIFEFCETTLKQECQETLEPRSIIIWTQQLLEVCKKLKLVFFLFMTSELRKDFKVVHIVFCTM